MKATNYPLFACGLIVATTVFFAIIPGLDILAWYLLQPDGFWQKMILIALEVITAFWRIILGSFIWVAIGTLAAEVSE